MLYSKACDFYLELKKNFYMITIDNNKIYYYNDNENHYQIEIVISYAKKVIAFLFALTDD